MIVDSHETKQGKEPGFLTPLYNFGIKYGLVRKYQTWKIKPEEQWKIKGSKTEGALLLLLIKRLKRSLEWINDKA
jgi:hypothetical protein